MMNTANFDTHQHASLAKNVKGVLLLQALATVIALGACLVIALVFGSELLALLKAASFGCLLAFTGTWLSARSIRRATEFKHDTAAAQTPLATPVSLTPIFSGLLNKLVIVGGGIAIGLIVLSLNPIAMIASYLFVQFAGATQLLFFNH